jgi:hypothetical protein
MFADAVNVWSHHSHQAVRVTADVALADVITKDNQNIRLLLSIRRLKRCETAKETYSLHHQGETAPKSSHNRRPSKRAVYEKNQ